MMEKDEHPQLILQTLIAIYRVKENHLNHGEFVKDISSGLCTLIKALRSVRD